MESPASGADSYSDADSRYSSPSAHTAKKRKPNSANCTLEGSLIKWWIEIRGSDRQPWDLPSPNNASQRARGPSTPGPATTFPASNPALRNANQLRPPKPGKKPVKVTLVSPPAGRSCGPFMCHGLHNSYLIDERSAILKENPSTARIAAEKKKALTPKPFLVGGRGATGATGPAKRPIPWRTLRLRAAKDSFQLRLDLPEEEVWRYYREKQLNCAPRLVALQNRKLRQQISARASSAATGAVGNTEAFKAIECLRILCKNSDGSDEEPPPPIKNDTGLRGALVVLPSDPLQSDPIHDAARLQASKNAKNKDSKIKCQKDPAAKKPLSAKIQFTSKKGGSGTLTTTTISFGLRREPQKKLTKQKSRTAVRVPSRAVLVKKSHSRKQMQRKRCQTTEVPLGTSSTPVSLCVQVKSCVEGTRTDVYNMFGSPAAAHARGAVGRNREHHVRGSRRRSESQLVSAASSEAAKWLANRSAPRRQAAGLPVVQLLLPSAGDLSQPAGDSRPAPGTRRTKVSHICATPSQGPSAVLGLPFPARSTPSEHSAKIPKKWSQPPRRRDVLQAEQAATSSLRRYFGAPSSRLTMDEIGQDFNIDWSEIFRSSKERAKSTRSGYETYKSLDTDRYSVVSNDYVDIEPTEVDRTPNIPSKLRMLGNMPKQLFGRNEKGTLDEEATMMRMGFPPKQKACMETQVTPRIKEVFTPTAGSRRLAQNRAHMEQLDVKRSVEVSAGATVSAESAIPLAFRREGGNQAFKTVLDLVLQNAEGRNSAGCLGGAEGGGGGDTRKGGSLGGRQGGEDYSMFRNFLSQALKPDEIPMSPTSPSFSFNNAPQHSSNRALPKNVLDLRKSYPKSAEDGLKILNLPRHTGEVRADKQRTIKDPRHFADISNLEGHLSPRGGGSRSGRTFGEMKSSATVSGLVTDTCREFVSPQGPQPPAISRSRTVTPANLGDLITTLRRAEKLS